MAAAQLEDGDNGTCPATPSQPQSHRICAITAVLVRIGIQMRFIIHSYYHYQGRGRTKYQVLACVGCWCLQSSCDSCASTPRLVFLAFPGATPEWPTTGQGEPVRGLQQPQRAQRDLKGMPRLPVPHYPLVPNQTAPGTLLQWPQLNSAGIRGARPLGGGATGPRAGQGRTAHWPGCLSGCNQLQSEHEALVHCAARSLPLLDGGRRRRRRTSPPGHHGHRMLQWPISAKTRRSSASLGAQPPASRRTGIHCRWLPGESVCGWSSRNGSASTPAVLVVLRVHTSSRHQRQLALPTPLDSPRPEDLLTLYE
ncbi:hypothetical protein PCL_10244 [Purpureocillium lilacinum]|uniref:Uncharacterized protein n=1 Tax=Purpureocillium lilacinum TaxID=33203 RepID=A0A2U3EFD5_PURLI|nr:hypothetical protein Purlil1_3872 [Purpureocillium lilacinum]PWI73229.1 hypothetical protein PCL_10244 [Purpureocillium lilacinum]